ncbi:MAG: hypothetical protein IPL53_06255 [Ignavibacteria bacterium]|nr:hypothetical protein [Ignavibacteria bacterium]
MRSGIDFKKINFINIIGTSGSGKTTFGRELSEILKIPLLEMDKIFWKPDWTIPDELEFFSKLKDELNSDRWILDGNYKRTTFIKWQKTEVVIWLDYSFHRTFYRSLSRSLSRAISQKELWENTGNRNLFPELF